MKIKIYSLGVLLAVMPIVFILILSVGLRPSWIGSDTTVYMNFYRDLGLDKIDHFCLDYFFEAIARFFVMIDLPVWFFFSFICLLNFIIIGLLTNVINNYLHLKSNDYQLFILIFIYFLLSPFFYATQVNIIRDGTAILCMYLFFFLILCRANTASLAFVVMLILGFHNKSIIYLPLALLVPLSYSLVSTSVFILALIYITGVSQKILFFASAIIPEDLYQTIVNYGVYAEHTSGIRLDFAGFTIVAGLFFWLIGTYFLHEDKRTKFINLVKIYWILTIPFFCLGFAGFSDRYLYPAWLYLSILSAVFSNFYIPKSAFSTLTLYLDWRQL